MTTVVGLLIICGFVALTTIVGKARTAGRKEALARTPASDRLMVPVSLDRPTVRGRVRTAAASAGFKQSGSFGDTEFFQTKDGLQIEVSTTSTASGTEVRVARTGVRSVSGRPIAIDAHRRFVAELNKILAH